VKKGGWAGRGVRSLLLLLAIDRWSSTDEWGRQIEWLNTRTYDTNWHSEGPELKLVIQDPINKTENLLNYQRNPDDCLHNASHLLKPYCRSISSGRNICVGGNLAYWHYFVYTWDYSIFTGFTQNQKVFGLVNNESLLKLGLIVYTYIRPFKTRSTAGLQWRS